MAVTRVEPIGTSQSLPKRSRKHHWLSWISNFEKKTLVNTLCWTAAKGFFECLCRGDRCKVNWMPLGLHMNTTWVPLGRHRVPLDYHLGPIHYHYGATWVLKYRLDITLVTVGYYYLGTIQILLEYHLSTAWLRYPFLAYCQNRNHLMTIDRAYLCLVAIIFPFVVLRLLSFFVKEDTFSPCINLRTLSPQHSIWISFCHKWQTKIQALKLSFQVVCMSRRVFEHE